MHAPFDDTMAGTFNDFLTATVVRVEDGAIRERDLFQGLKHYCWDNYIQAPTWQEFHQLLKHRNAYKVPANGMVLLRFLQWNEDSRHRPAAATSYHQTPDGRFEEVVHI